MIQGVSGTHMLPAIEFAESEEFKISDEYNYTGHDKWKMVTDKQVLFFFVNIADLKSLRFCTYLVKQNRGILKKTTNQKQ